MQKRERPRSSLSVHLLSSAPRPSKASACLDRTQSNTMLGSCFQHGSGTDEIVPGLSRERREQRAELSCHPASFSLRVPGFLPGLQPLPLRRRMVCSSGQALSSPGAPWSLFFCCFYCCGGCRS